MTRADAVALQQSREGSTKDFDGNLFNVGRKVGRRFLLVHVDMENGPLAVVVKADADSKDSRQSEDVVLVPRLDLSEPLDLLLNWRESLIRDHRAV